VLIVLCALGGGQVASAQALPAQDAKCRNALGVASRKLIQTAVIEMESCEKLRMLGKLPATTDCSSLLQLPAASWNKIVKAQNNVDTQAQRKCIPPVPAPADLGYPTQCPGTCPAITISTYTDVADCLICRAEYDARLSIYKTYGQFPPVQGANTVALKCQGYIGTALKNYAIAKSTQQQSCQYKEDQGKIPSTECRTEDMNGKIEKALVSLQKQIAKCTPTALASLTSCATTIADEQACVAQYADGLADALFFDVYEPQAVPTPTP
jgi:hypothetical protein